jgi:putative endonuclease
MQVARSPKQPCVYLLASKRNGVLYIGVTSDISKRVSLHKQGVIEGFPKKYGVHRLVYYEIHKTMPEAIRREKQLKKWNRAWKVRLIEQLNPEWCDLWDETGEVSVVGIGGQELPREFSERLN